MSTSRSLNKVMLIGNLTRNPVLRTTANNSVVCTFGLATNSSWKDSDANVQERTEFHNIVAWNKLAEICAQLLAVGMSIYIEGELRTRVWVDGNGIKHYRTEVKAQDMKVLDSKNKKGVGIDAAKKAGEGAGDEYVADEEVSNGGANGNMNTNNSAPKEPASGRNNTPVAAEADVVPSDTKPEAQTAGSDDDLF